MIRRPPRSTLFPYTDALPISEGSARVDDAERRAGRQAHDGVELPAADQAVEPRAGVGEEGAPLADGQLVDGVEVEDVRRVGLRDRKSTRLNSSHANISYAVFC